MYARSHGSTEIDRDLSIDSQLSKADCDSASLLAAAHAQLVGKWCRGWGNARGVAGMQRIYSTHGIGGERELRSSFAMYSITGEGVAGASFLTLRRGP